MAERTRKLVTGSDDNTAKIWRCSESGTEVVAVLQHAAPVTAIDVSSKGQILTCSRDKTAKVWDSKGNLLHTYSDLPSEAHKDYINTGLWCKNGRYEAKHFVTASDDHTVIVWDAQNKAKYLELSDPHYGHHEEVGMACWSRNGEMVATCSLDRSAIVWGVGEKTKSVLFSAPGRYNPQDRHGGCVYSVDFNEKGTRLLTASQDCTAKLWNVQAGVLERSFGEAQDDTAASRRSGHTDACLYATFNSPGHHELADKFNNLIVTCGIDSKAILWDIRKEGCVAEIKTHDGAIWSAQFSTAASDGGKRLLICSHDMAATIFDLAKLTGAQDVDKARSHLLKNHTGILWHASLSPDEQAVVTCSDDRTVRLWTLTSGFTRPPSVPLKDENLPGKTSHALGVTCAAWFPGQVVAVKPRVSVLGVLDQKISKQSLPSGTHPV